MPKKGYKRTPLHELHRFESRNSWRRDKATKEKIALTLRNHPVLNLTKSRIKEKTQLKIYQTMKLEEHMSTVHGCEKRINKRKKYLGCELCKWIVPKEINKKEKKRYDFQKAQVLQPIQEQLKEMDNAIAKVVEKY